MVFTVIAASTLEISRNSMLIKIGMCKIFVFMRRPSFFGVR
jgi:hypothetical protein